MKKILPISIIIVSIVLSSCGSDKTKADASVDTPQKNSVDTAVIAKPEEKPQQSGATRSIDPGNHDKNAILANIDQYLVSKLAYPDPGTVTVENTLPDATIQKAYVEVNMVKDNGETRTDYYILINIEPGGSKTVKINNVVPGTKASSHVVKLKSDELTDGELIIVGSKFVPK